MECILNEDAKFPFGPREPRSPGLHLSTITRDIAAAVSASSTSYGIEDEPSEETRMRWEIGWAWEDLVAERMSYEAGRPFHNSYAALRKYLGCTDLLSPQELRWQGIIMTPDGWDGERIHECKAVSAQSVSKTNGVFRPVNRLEWMLRTAFYCTALGTKRAVFHIWHYAQYDREPAYRQWNLTFDDSTISDHYWAIINHAKAKGLIDAAP